jgi:hypothetical protein
LPIQIEFRAHEARLTFSHALARERAADESNYTLRTWDLKRTPNYGSQHFNEQELAIEHASVSADGKVVTLAVPDLAPTWGMSIKYQLQGQNGRMFQGELHGSIHNLE